MFIFKAVLRVPDHLAAAPSPEEYFVTQAESYEIRHTDYNRLEGGNRVGSSEPMDTRVIQLSLLDHGQTFPEGRTLFIGYLQNFERVYVMNEHGKTIDKIQL